MALLVDIRKKNDVLKHIEDITNLKPSQFDRNPVQTIDNHQQPLSKVDVIDLPIENSQIVNPQSSLVSNGNSNKMSIVHPILFMNDEDFTSTSIGTMMSWYGEASGGHKILGIL